MAASVTPGNAPFQGGGFFPSAPPTSGPTGSIAGANVGGSLISGVAGSSPMMARNNRGSNISIPYARVVLHSAGRTALPTTGAANPGQLVLGKPNPSIISETDRLFTGRLCFILGRRGAGFPAGEATSDINRILGMEYQQSTNATVTSRMQSRLSHFASGGVDMNTMSRLCSFEYLELYFYHVLRARTINLGDAIDMSGDIKYKNLPNAIGQLNAVDGTQLLGGLKTIAAKTPAAPVAGPAEAAVSGVFARDEGPFLRGMTIDSSMVDKVYRGGGKAPTNLGDVVAFQALEKKLKDLGALDWTPDGVVLSKLTSGAPGNDGLVDDEIDSRDGQLFNVTINGPAITSTYCHDEKLEVMPLDKLFICIVGDVWVGADAAAVKTAWDNAALPKTDANYKSYEDAFKEHIKDDARNASAAIGAPTAGAANETITNLQVVRMTSSQMVNYSAYRKGHEKSRMGMPLGADGGRYIIGGWCIGTVIDSSAARATHDGVSLVGAVKRAKTSHACNAIVGIEWWSADRMYRRYMNRGSAGEANKPSTGTIRSRYDPSRRVVDKKNLPVSAR
jgi:hypothetical protein